jgi:predicted transposase YbfD/YdcC
VESTREIQGQSSTEYRYYILSLPPVASKFAEAVRGHWGIENSLHWKLDVGFREDESRIRKDNSPQNMAVMRHIALNLLKKEKTFKKGMHAKRFNAALNNDYLVDVLFR